MTILPTSMNSPEARALITAICLQESGLIARRQTGGPARGYAQFEQGGGVTGVFNHPSTAATVKILCAALDVAPTIVGIYGALEQNDILAAAMARLLLWTLPTPLPGKANPEAGWLQYVAAWRPGKPHRETWDMNYLHAWNAVEAAGVLADQDIEARRVRDAAVDLITGLNKLSGIVAGLTPR